MIPAVCIVAAGVGKRMGPLTENVSKALIPINGKAIISHVIDQFPKECSLVIAIGYKKDSLREYLLAAHGDRHLTFVDVENYEGPGSGPGFSMNQCRQYLHCPFYFTTIDTLINKSLPDLSSNWIAVGEVNESDHYALAELDPSDGHVVHFTNKGQTIPTSNHFAYTGVCGVRDHVLFWESFDKYMKDFSEQECEHVGVFYDKYRFLWDTFQVGSDWYDTGTQDKYYLADRKMSKKKDFELKKNTGEITYFVNGKVIKLNDSEKTHNKIERAKWLGQAVPELSFKGKHLFAYEWIDGEILYEIDNTTLNRQFFNWCARHLWRPCNVNVEQFRKSCLLFYKVKTRQRVGQYLSKKPSFYDQGWTINGIEHVPIEQLLDSISDRMLESGQPVIFHGDLNFGNALIGTNGKFKVIDWRDSFADQKICGDIYYDLGKLYAGIDVSWMLMSQFQFHVEIGDGEVKYDYETTDSLKETIGCFEEWVVENGFDLRKVKTIATLIPLNMSPLHSDDIGDFLFFHGYYRLGEVV